MTYPLDLKFVPFVPELFCFGLQLQLPVYLLFLVIPVISDTHFLSYPVVHNLYIAK